MGEETIRWTVNIDRQTDIDLRTYLAQRGMKKGDLSKFIEQAVKWRLFDLTLAEAREGFADLDPVQADMLFTDALSETRKHTY